MSFIQISAVNAIIYMAQMNFYPSFQGSLDNLGIFGIRDLHVLLFGISEFMNISARKAVLFYRNK